MKANDNRKLTLTVDKEKLEMGKRVSADMLIRATLNAGKVMTFATSQRSSWKAHFTKRFPDAKIEEFEGGLRISK